MRAPDARSLNFRGHLIIGRSVSVPKWKFQSACDKQVPPIDVSARIWGPRSQWGRRDRGKSFRCNRFARSRITRSKEGNRQLVGFPRSGIYLYEFPGNVTIVWWEAAVNSLPTDSVSCYSRDYSSRLQTINSFLRNFPKGTSAEIASDFQSLNSLNQ